MRWKDNRIKEEMEEEMAKERCSGVIVCQIHRRIPQSRVASLLGSLVLELLWITFVFFLISLL